MPKQKKKRLDQCIFEENKKLTLNQIQSFIIQGAVTVDGCIITKPGTQIAKNQTIILHNTTPKYVSRAGFKLEAALNNFDITIDGIVALDAGISTGGFTDCLLQHGAKRVYGVDVGYGQVHEKIRNDSRLILFEKTNLRYLEKLPELVDLVTLDLSFISIITVMPTVSTLLTNNGKIITLIKPQFEADRKDICKGGIVNNPIIHKQIIEKITQKMLDFNFIRQGIIESPITGASAGNKEFLAIFKNQNQKIIEQK